MPYPRSSRVSDESANLHVGTIGFGLHIIPQSDSIYGAHDEMAVSRIGAVATRSTSSCAMMLTGVCK